MSADGSLWAITSFFNASGSARRLENYRRFRAALPVPLATIELGFGGRWHLSSRDADLYVAIDDGDVLWQKERLLNLLLPRLPATCRHVAWLDADVLFTERDWPRRAAEVLAHAPIAQLYSSLRYLGPASTGGVGCETRAPSMAAEMRSGRSAASVLERATDREGAAPGMAWVARRELLARHGFFDTAVIGGGDTAMLCAAYGAATLATRVHHMNAKQVARYSAWAERLHGDVGGQVGLVSGEIHHLWHGELARRDAAGRHVALAAHDFDPGADLAPGSQGAWRWASDKPALHALLVHYFQARGDNSD